MAGNGKINHGKGMFDAAALAFLFQNTKLVKEKSPFSLWGTIRGERAAAGNICGCIGFVKDRNTGLNVPNTLLKKDIRDVVANPVQKIYAVFSKLYMSEKYSLIEEMDKSFKGKKIYFSGEIEKLLER